MWKKDVFTCVDGKMTFDGYIGELEKYLVENHVVNAEVWALFVRQFRNKTDFDYKWRGEYWGKAMRGAALLYRATKNPAIYQAMKETIEDLLSTQEESGRISTYPLEREFTSWDMWSRKYVLLGNLYFYEICEDEAFKEKLLAALIKHADYIVAHVGEGEGKIPVLKTSDAWGSMNACSNLEPFVKMYKLTNKPEYLAFAEYIVSTGLCDGANLIELSLQGVPPYQYPHPKAYEMISCFQGLLELYTVTKNPAHLQAVINFTDMVYESEVDIRFNADVETIRLNGKIAFKKGPYVLARDQKTGEDIAKPVALQKGKVQEKRFENTLFDCDYAYKIQTLDGEITLCDYAHVGKEYDTEDCNIGVWLEQKN